MKFNIKVLALILILPALFACSTSQKGSSGHQVKNKMYCSSQSILDNENDHNESIIKSSLEGTPFSVLRVKGGGCLDVILVSVRKHHLMGKDNKLSKEGSQLLWVLSQALTSENHLTNLRIAVHAYTGDQRKYKRSLRYTMEWASLTAQNLTINLKPRSQIISRGFGGQHKIIQNSEQGHRSLNDRIEILITSTKFTGPMDLSVSHLAGYTLDIIKSM